MNRKVKIFFKADDKGNTRLPFETTEFNIENQERLHGNLIKNIEFVDDATAKPARKILPTENQAQNTSVSITDEAIIMSLLSRGSSIKDIAKALSIPVQKVNKVVGEKTAA